MSAIAPGYGRVEALPPSPSASAQRPASVPASDVALAVGGSVPFVVWYDPATLVPDEIDVPSQSATVTRVRD
ncbi:MAG: hypothetical protein JO199_09255 [Candidatus Eremiobacteraeota bacterium]|nr:hypothetical protein [Candidatus Eremiobacteraeota bacterium]